MRKIRMQSRTLVPALTLALTLAIGLSVAAPAQAQTLTTLYSFTGLTDGGFPYTGLVRDSEGNLYGMTELGGSGLFGNAFGAGTLFKVDTSGNETVLHNFGETVMDGEFPFTGNLLRDTAGNLYGTTEYGGAYDSGTIFRVSPTGHEDLASFTGGANGGFPLAGLVADAAGNGYGTTFVRGTGCAPYGCGTVFKISSAGKVTALYSFTGGADGDQPKAGLVRDSAGNLYGTTAAGGGSGRGIVFKVDTTGKEAVLYTFGSQQQDGSDPLGGLVQDSAGNLYGTTASGGSSGGGTVFKVDTTGKETVLYSFCSQSGCADGVQPQAGLVRDSAGNLYGSTVSGGASFQGTVFELDTTGKETVLYNFSGGTDGGSPYASLIRDAAGNLYGTTSYGGIFSCGTVFKITP
jgi:uncharacterized repeat protein (TIGR03803 family)